MADIAATIETIEHRWMRAWVRGDVRDLKTVTSRNFRFLIGSTSSAVLDRKSWLEAAASRFTCSAYRFGDIYVRKHGRTAIFATQLEITAEMEGNDWSGQYWITDLWRKSAVRRQWLLEERILSRPESDSEAASAIRALQLWR